MGKNVQLYSDSGLIMTLSWSLRLFTRTALLVVSVAGAPTEDTEDAKPDTGSQGYQGPPSQYTKPFNSFSVPPRTMVPSWPQAPSQGWQRPSYPSYPSYNTKPFLPQVPKMPRNYMPSQPVSGVEPISSDSTDPVSNQPVLQPAIQPASTLPYPYQASPSYSSSPCGPSMSSGCGSGYNPGYGSVSSGYNPGYGSGSSGYNPGYGSGSSGYTPGYGTGNSGYNPGYGSGSSGYNPGTGSGNSGHNPGYNSFTPLPGNGNCYNICGSRQKCGSYGGSYGGGYGCRPSRPVCKTRCDVTPQCNGNQWQSNGGNSFSCAGSGWGYGYNSGYNSGYSSYPSYSPQPNYSGSGG